MDQKLRRQHPPAFKAKVAIEAIKEQKTVAELSSIYGIHPTQITKWKKKAMDFIQQVFSDKFRSQLKSDDELISELYKQIGKLQVEWDWLKKRLDSLKKRYHLGVNDLKEHIEKSGQNTGINIPSIKRQAELLGISGASVYYQPKEVDPFTLAVMNRIDEIYTKRPFYGVRKITEQLKSEDILVNHKRVHNLMQYMGIAGIIPKKNLSKNNTPHIRYPYLLNGVSIIKPNQVRGTDITYIRMQYGFLYLTVFLDWYSRFILSRRVSTTPERAFCLEAAVEAMNLFGSPEIVNQDRGVQYTHKDYCDIWEEKEVRISMDGRGRAMDNIFTERLWRTVKYEEVYLKSYETVLEAKQQIGEYIDFYNNERFHQSLNNKTPAEIYFRKEKNLVLNSAV